MGMIYSRSPSVISQVNTVFLGPLEILDNQVLRVLQVPKASQVLKVSEGEMFNELIGGGGEKVSTEGHICSHPDVICEWIYEGNQLY